MKKFFKEFGAFLTKRGNILDLAIAVVVGAAFGLIITSLVNDIVMPLISWIFGGADFSSLKVVLKKAETIDGVEYAENAIRYGAFINAIVNFIIIALCIFLMFKIVTSIHRKMKQAAEAEMIKKGLKEAPKAAGAAAPAKPTTEELLTQIRDLLQAQNSPKAGKTETDNK